MRLSQLTLRSHVTYCKSEGLGAAIYQLLSLAVPADCIYLYSAGFDVKPCLLKLPEEKLREIEALGDNWDMQIVAESKLRALRRATASQPLPRQVCFPKLPG